MLQLFDLVYHFVLHHAVLLMALSIGGVVAAVIAVPMVVVRLPEDYFLHHRRKHLRNNHLLLDMTLVILKNTLGYLLFIAGFVMLFTPGPGLLTIMVGLILMNYPGKFRLEKWIVTRFGVFRAINWLRRKRGKPPLIHP